MVNVAELELSRSAIAGLSQESRTHLPSRVRSATANLSETGSGVIHRELCLTVGSSGDHTAA